VSKHSLASFLKACGARGPLLLGVEDLVKHKTVRRVLAQPFALLGNDVRADVPLDDPLLNGRHAYIQVVGGRVFCADLHSRTGTYWEDGARQAGWLRRGQAVRVGAFHVRLLEGGADGPPDGEPDVDPLAPGSQGARRLPGVTLEFSNGGAQQVRWRMNRLLALVGNAPESTIRLRDVSVSRTHCSLIYTPRGVWVLDLLGREGVSVNGALTRFARLDEGDDVRIGNFFLRPWYEKLAPAGAYPEDDTGARAPALPAPAGFALTAEGVALSRPGIGVANLPLWRPAPAALEDTALGTALTSSPLGTLLATDPALENPEAAKAVLVPLVQQLSLMQNQMFDQFQQAMLMMFQRFSALHWEQMGFVRQELDRVQEITAELQTLRAELLKHPPAAPAGPAAFGSAPKPAAPEAARAATAPPAGPPAAPADQKKAPPPTPSSSSGELDIHALLCQRISAMQKERQSHWQKILNYLTGKGT
jgi:pSer/pThr/pTyr-binding forkhead associated (FHA) protein